MTEPVQDYGLGHYGQVIFDMIIEKKPEQYQTEPAKEKLAKSVKRSQDVFTEQVKQMLGQGFTVPQAIEEIWPEIIASFNINK